MPESKLHLDLRTALYLVLRLAFADRARVGSDQFVYWNPREPRKCLAPDAFLKLGHRDDEAFATWKAWERGAPDVAVEIVSASDARSWKDKLDDYHELGVSELVRFDPAGPPGARLEVWDLLDGDLAPREIANESAESQILAGHFWVVRPIADYEAGLRLAIGSPAGALLPTERELAERETLRADTERAAREQERSVAERRIAELEAELAKRG